MFVTSTGRIGEFMRSRTCDTPVESVRSKSGEQGYLYVNDSGKQKLLHRVVAELFMAGEIKTKIEETGVPWKNLRVDHVDGDKKNNSVGNLLICTVAEHNRKHARAVEEIDELGNPTGVAWRSNAEAAVSIGANAGNLHAVCMGKSKMACGIRVRYTEYGSSDHSPKRKLSRTGL